MKCSSALRYLSSYIEGDVRYADEIERHLRECAECRAAYDEIAALISAAGSAPAVSAPPFLKERIIRAVAESERRRRFVRRAPVFAGAAVAAIALLAVVLLPTLPPDAPATGFSAGIADASHVQVASYERPRTVSRPVSPQTDVQLASVAAARDTVPAALDTATITIPEGWVHVGTSPYVSSPGVEVGGRRYVVPQMPDVVSDSLVNTSVPSVGLHTVTAEY
jgi:anti-sigma factor RsiW